MPRFYFHTEDGRCVRDNDGTDLPDIDAARVEATRIMGQLLDEDAEGLWVTETFRIVVTDGDGLTLLTVDTSAISSPAAGTQHLHAKGIIAPVDGEAQRE